MIITKDNLLRFIKEKKYVTPTIISQIFDTTTMIASAALSELAKDKLIAISNLKIGSTPYYYDTKQKEALIELGEKHFSKYDKQVFLKLKENQVLNDNSFSIQERLAIVRIKDFAFPIEINNDGQILKFWVWYLRNLQETKTQILNVINSQTQSKKIEKKETFQIKKNSNLLQDKLQTNKINNNQKNLNLFKPQIIEENSFEDKVDIFIKNYFNENYLKLIKKIEKKTGIYYKAKININKIEVIFTCFYYDKKPKDSQIISFYTSSQNPKIIFIKNASKKHFNLANNLENLTIINI